MFHLQCVEHTHGVGEWIAPESECGFSAGSPPVLPSGHPPRPLPGMRGIGIQCDMLDFCYVRCKNSRDFYFFTGITSETFKELYKFVGGDEVCDKLKYTKTDGTPRRARRSKLCPKDQLFVTLIRLRRGVPIKDLARLFRVSTGFMSTTVYTWIRFLSLQLQALLDKMFVSAAAQDAHAKDQDPFANFPNLRVIIDCAELKIQKPFNFRMQSNTWSAYKSDNTLKYLFGISRSTGLSFVSRGCEGSMSDKQVVMVSGFLDHLRPNDVVMCDRGFDIDSELNARGVHIAIPAFLGNRTHFTAAEMRKSQDIASKRIYVEMFIKKVKDFRILRGKIPNKLLPIMDDLVVVCSVLTQFDKPIIAAQNVIDMSDSDR